jgi:26S proteasome regulatory subunit N1
MLEILGVIEQPTLSAVAKTLVKACAYAGTGSVLTMQELLRVCAAHPEAEDKEKAEKEKEDAANAAAAAAAGAGPAGGAAAGAAAARAGAGAGAGAAGAGAAAASTAEEEAAAKHGAAAAGKYLHQSAAVLGLALVAMGEELSVDMATRMADHLLQYGDTSVRRMVPLALALLHVSDPEYGIVDILSKLSHDPNVETAQAAIFGMGLVSAGTNNSRVAGLLRTLATFYRSEPNTLFVVRLAQGLTHMGKGLLTLNPIHADRNLVSPVAISGILSALLLFMDGKTSLHGASKWHILLYTLSTAIHPRFLTTTDEAGAPLPVEVRVGAAVETVGQAGRPKTITGFQTHTTPVLVGVRDRAELVDDAASGGQWYPLTPILENVIILRRNPHYKPRPGAGTAGGAGKVGSSAAAAAGAGKPAAAGAGKPAAAGAGAGAGAGR